MLSTPLFLGVLFLVQFSVDVSPEKVLDASKGSTVILHPGAEEASITIITWKHGDDLAAEWFGEKVTLYRGFKDRCTLNTTSGIFIINNVQLEDRGVYTPEINNHILAGTTLRVFSRVPKPNITHGCKPEQTKCTLSCTFDRTEDMGDVWISWILDDRREKGDRMLEITEETKEKTFICSLDNLVSSEKSTVLQNPLLTHYESGRTHIAVGIVLGLLAVCVAVLLIFHFKHTKTEEDSEDLNKDPSDQVNRETGSGSS